MDRMSEAARYANLGTFRYAANQGVRVPSSWLIECLDEIERLSGRVREIEAERDALVAAGNALATTLNDEVMPRYEEMFTFGGLGADASESVAVQLADASLANWRALTRGDNDG